VPVGPQLDASTPALASHLQGVSTALSTSSFTAPANALLVAFCMMDTSSGVTTEVGTVTDSGGLTWTRRARKGLVSTSDEGAGTNSLVEVWWAVTSTAAARTVTLTQSGSKAKSIAVKVFTADGGAPSVGGYKVAFSASGIPSATLTTNARNSWVWACASDWSAQGAGTMGAGQTRTDLHDATGLYTGRVWKQDALTAEPGSVTMNMTGPSGQNFNMVAVEIKDNPAAAPTTGDVFDETVFDSTVFDTPDGGSSVTGAGATVLPALTGAGAGTATTTGTAVATLPGLTGAGAAQVRTTGTAAATLPGLVGAGVAAVKTTATGSGSLPGLTGFGAGQLAASGSSTGSLQPLAGAGAGQVRLTGTGSGELPGLTGSGAAAVATAGTGSGTLLSLGGAGTGQVRTGGAGAGILPNLTGSGGGLVGSAGNAGSGTHTLPQLVGAGTGQARTAGASVANLPPLAGAGAATLRAPGSGAGLLTALSGAGAGETRTDGSGAGVLAPLLGAGAGLVGGDVGDPVDDPQLVLVEATSRLTLLEQPAPVLDLAEAVPPRLTLTIPSSRLELT